MATVASITVRVRDETFRPRFMGACVASARDAVHLRATPDACEGASMADEKPDPADNFPAGYEPAEVWEWKQGNGGRFANINRPIAGATHDKELPVGEHPLQLYSLATPNGVKVTFMLEELLEAGHDAEYDAWLINIGEGDQFGSGFVDINPNSKIPALHDRGADVRVFESGSILIHLAEKFQAFLPASGKARTETFNWLMWQMGSAPYLGGGFGHFYAYAPIKIEYAIDRFSMEVKRQLDVLDRHLANEEFMAGGEMTIADFAILPWYGLLVEGGKIYGDSGRYLAVHEYENVRRWQGQLMERPAWKRGRMVNRAFGPPHEQLRERHAASDFETRTQDKLEGDGQG